MRTNPAPPSAARPAPLLRLLLLWLCVLPFGTGHAAGTDSPVPFTLPNLLHALAKAPHGHASFQETKYLNILDIPISSSGELRYLPPDRMEKRIGGPHPELMVLDGKHMSLQRDGHTYTLDLTEHPGALAYASSMRALLAGQLGSLQAHYRMQLSGDWHKWSLQLTPTDSAISNLISSMTVSGHDNRIRRIAYQQADGDHSVMTIEPLPDDPDSTR